METKLKIADHKWLRDGKTIYTLHEASNYFNGKPALINKFYLSVQPDTGNGIENDQAEEIAEQIHDALTIANETGLTPRELLEQRNELLEILIEVKSFFDNPKDSCFSDQQLEKLNNVIQKSKQQ